MWNVRLTTPPPLSLVDDVISDRVLGHAGSLVFICGRTAAPPHRHITEISWTTQKDERKGDSCQQNSLLLANYRLLLGGHQLQPDPKSLHAAFTPRDAESERISFVRVCEWGPRPVPFVWVFILVYILKSNQNAPFSSFAYIVGERNAHKLSLYIY